MPGNVDVRIRAKDLTQKGYQTAQRGMQGLRRAYQSMGKLFSLQSAIVVGSVGLVIDKIVDLGKSGAVMTDVSRAFHNMVSRIGVDSGQLLEDMRRATNGTISDLKLMQQANTALLLGIPIERMDQLLAIARNAAVSTGQSVEFMTQSIITGIGRQSRLILDNLGIIVKVEEANQKYAEAMGLTVDQLGEAGRQQAFLNAVLDAGQRQMESAGAGASSAVDPFARFTTSLENLKNVLGLVLLPVLSDFLQMLTQIVNKGSELVGVFRVLPSMTDQALAQQFSKSIEQYNKTLRAFRAPDQAEGVFGQIAAGFQNVLGGGTVSRLGDRRKAIEDMLGKIGVPSINTEGRSNVDVLIDAFNTGGMAGLSEAIGNLQGRRPAVRGPQPLGAPGGEGREFLEAQRLTRENLARIPPRGTAEDIRTRMLAGLSPGARQAQEEALRGRQFRTGLLRDPIQARTQEELRQLQADGMAQIADAHQGIVDTANEMGIDANIARLAAKKDLDKLQQQANLRLQGELDNIRREAQANELAVLQELQQIQQQRLEDARRQIELQAQIGAVQGGRAAQLVERGLITVGEGALGISERLERAKEEQERLNEELRKAEEEHQNRINDIQQQQFLRARDRARMLTEEESRFAKLRQDIEEDLEDAKLTAYEAFVDGAIKSLGRLVEQELLRLGAKALVGAGVGFLVGGPAGAAVGAQSALSGFLGAGSAGQRAAGLTTFQDVARLEEGVRSIGAEIGNFDLFQDPVNDSATRLLGRAQAADFLRLFGEGFNMGLRAPNIPQTGGGAPLDFTLNADLRLDEGGAVRLIEREKRIQVRQGRIQE